MTASESISGLRIDRFATLHIGWPVSKMLLGTRGNRIPILMYHGVREGTSDPRPYYETNVSPQVFSSQIRQLQQEGFRAVSLDHALESLQAGGAQEKLVVITFDDGYRDFYESAFPILAECNFTATVFLIAGHTGEHPARFKEKDCLTWQEVRELRSQGISFGSHTVTHPQLKLLGMKQVEEELMSSKRMIEDHISAGISSFSYPYAFPEADEEFTRQLKEILLQCGYQNGVTTILGTANPGSDRFFLPRLPVNRWDDPQFFQAKLEGSYDWLRGPQYLSKLLGNLRLSRPRKAIKALALS